jgi:hypothetical protein
MSLNISVQIPLSTMAKAISTNYSHPREIRFCAEPELREFLNKQCQAEGINRSELIRRAILGHYHTRGYDLPPEWSRGHIR